MPTCVHHPAYKRLVIQLVAARTRLGLSQAEVAQRLRVSRQ